MKESPNNSHPEERLNPADLQNAREKNLAEADRLTTTRIYIVEGITEFPDTLVISYGGLSQDLQLEAKGKVQPGTKLVVVQQSEDQLSQIEAVYLLGETLVEPPQPSPTEIPPTA